MSTAVILCSRALLNARRGATVRGLAPSQVLQAQECEYVSGPAPKPAQAQVLPSLLRMPPYHVMHVQTRVPRSPSAISSSAWKHALMPLKADMEARSACQL